MKDRVYFMWYIFVYFSKAKWFGIFWNYFAVNLIEHGEYTDTVWCSASSGLDFFL